jgi:hypothetical protein
MTTHLAPGTAQRAMHAVGAVEVLAGVVVALARLAVVYAAPPERAAVGS